MNRPGLALVLTLGLIGCGSDTVPPLGCDPAANPCTDPANPVCDPVTHHCGPAPDGGVPADLSVADAASPDLAPMCTLSSQCSDVMPICAAGVCGGCNGPSDDAECQAHKATTPRCDATAHICVTCRAATQDTDCTTTQPVCDTGVCRKCKAHSECTSLVCKDDGTCATPADTLYVDNKGGGCAAGIHTGAPNDPFCDIQPAVTALTTQHFIRVIGSLAPYGVVTLAGPSVTLVGPGGQASPSAQINGGTANAAVDVSAGSAVIVDGFEVMGGTHDGIDCSGATSTITVRASFIHSFNGLGVSASQCALTLDRDQVGPANSAGGINVGATTTYAITNCMVAGNGTIAAGVGLATSATGTFRHNTVVNNLVTSGLGGIDCGMSTKQIENSIVWNNTKDSTPSQIGKYCALVNSDIDETIAGNQNTAPDFVSVAGNDYHLNGRTTNNLACCIDQIASSPVTHDFDGTPRPINVKWDIGAHEVP
jgi:hypothetical protein